MVVNLSGEPDSGHIVNVASVPQRSPFRYPGGKTWLVPYMRQWIAGLDYRPCEFIEPFAGGGIVGLTVAFEELASCVVLAERDEQVAAVWQAILDGGAEKLAERIACFPLTEDNVRSALRTIPKTPEEIAFQTILKNRVHRGGILAPGTGLIKNGENNRGLQSRWYPQTLKRRILAIAGIRSRIRFLEGDGLSVLQQYQSHSQAAFFMDPPYTAGGKSAGRRLYTHHQLDHEKLFRIANELQGEFLMTYEDTQEIRELAQDYGFAIRTVAMKNTHHARMQELLITRA